MKIEFITKEEHTELVELFTKFPKLTFQNKGYEKINKNTLTDEENLKIKEIETILKKSILGFDSFTNFKLSNQEIVIRFQYDYGYDGTSIPFIGVGYIYLDDLLNGFRI